MASDAATGVYPNTVFARYTYQLSSALWRASRCGEEISFADAAREHSQSPSAESGGDIGWITRHETMPEAFSSAAFGLQVGQISQPVETKYGVHLIRCLEEKAGKITWQEVRKPLREAVIQYLFRWCADQERKHVKVKILLDRPTPGAIPTTDK